MQVVCLSASDRRLLCARFAEHGNSQRRMLDALREAGATDAIARIAARRRMERSFDLDLAEICQRHARRDADGTHPIEQIVVDFITEERHADGETQLWVLPERVLQLRELMDGRLVGDLES